MSGHVKNFPISLLLNFRYIHFPGIIRDTLLMLIENNRGTENDIRITEKKGNHEELPPRVFIFPVPPWSFS